MQSFRNWFASRWYGQESADLDGLKKEPDPRLDKTVEVDVERQLKIMRVRAKKLDYDAVQAQRLAKESFAKNDKQAAAKHLKRSKMLSAQSQMLTAQMTNLEHTQLTLESAATNTDMYHVMKGTRDVITTQMQQLNVDDVEELKDDLQKATEDMQEINEIFSTPLYGDPQEDNDIQQQLSAWEQESQIAESNEIEQLLPETPVHAVNNNNNNNNDDEGVKAVNKNGV